MRTTNIYALASTQVNPECPTVQVGKERLECTSNTYSCMCLHSAQALVFCRCVHAEYNNNSALKICSGSAELCLLGIIPTLR